MPYSHHYTQSVPYTTLTWCPPGAHALQILSDLRRTTFGLSIQDARKAKSRLDKHCPIAPGLTIRRSQWVRGVHRCGVSFTPPINASALGQPRFHDLKSSDHEQHITDKCLPQAGNFARCGAFADTIGTSTVLPIAHDALADTSGTKPGLPVTHGASTLRSNGH